MKPLKHFYAQIKPWLEKLMRFILRRQPSNQARYLMVAMVSSSHYIAGAFCPDQTKPEHITVANSVEAIATFADNHEVDKDHITLILCNNSYKLTIHDMPDLADDDLQDAIRWQIDNELDISPEDTAVDAFRVPDQGRVTESGYLATKPLKEVDSLQASFSEHNLKLTNITIAELGLTHLIAHLFSDNSQVLAVLYVTSTDQVQLMLVQQGTLLFIRKLGPAANAFNIEQNNNIIDQCQRTFAYAQNQRQLFPSTILLIQDISSKIKQPLENQLKVKVQVLDPGPLAPESNVLDDRSYPYYLPLIGMNLA